MLETSGTNICFLLSLAASSASKKLAKKQTKTNKNKKTIPAPRLSGLLPLFLFVVLFFFGFGVHTLKKPQKTPNTQCFVLRFKKTTLKKTKEKDIFSKQKKKSKNKFHF